MPGNDFLMFYSVVHHWLQALLHIFRCRYTKAVPHVHLSIVMFLQAPIPSIGSLGVFESKMPERNNSREENLDIVMVSKVTAATVRKTRLSSSVCSHRNVQWQLLMGQETRIRVLEIEAMSRSSLSLSQKDSTFFKVTSRTDNWVLKHMSVRDIADSDNSTWLLSLKLLPYIFLTVVSWKEDTSLSFWPLQ